MKTRKNHLLTAMLVLLAAVSGVLGWGRWQDDWVYRRGDCAYLRGRDLYANHNYDAALVEYQRVTRHSPFYATTQRSIGHNIYGRKWGQWEQGIPYLEEAYRVAPNDTKVLEDIGRAYVKIGRQQEGIEFLRKANTKIARSALDELSTDNG